MNRPVEKYGKNAIESLLIRGAEDLGKDLRGMEGLFRRDDAWRGLSEAMPLLTETVPTLPEDLQEILSLRFPDKFDLSDALPFGERLRYMETGEILAAIMETVLFRYWIHGMPMTRGFDPRLFWRHSLAVASISRDLARDGGHVDPDQAFLVGLCHDLGRVVLEKFGWRGYSDFLQLAQQSGGCLHVQEQELIGLGHQELGAWWLERFQVPAWLAEGVRRHHESGEGAVISSAATDNDPAIARLSETVQIADFIAWTQGLGAIPGPRQPMLAPKVTTTFDLEQQDWASIMSRLDGFLGVAADHYGYDMPNSMQFRKHLLGATVRLGQMVRSRQQGDVMAGVRRTGLSESVLVPHQSLDENMIIPNTLQAIRREYRFHTLCLFNLDPTDRCLVPGVRVPEFQGNRGFGHLRIPLTQVDSGFRECVRDRQPRIIRGRTSLEKEILRSIGVEEIGVVAVFGQMRVHGLLWMDCGNTRKKLVLSELTEVAVVARELGVALDHVLLYQDARKQVEYDALTGLLNRTRIEAGLRSSLDAARAKGAALSLLMTDLDQFRRVNDRLGNQRGDHVLKLFAEVQKRSVREGGLVGRFEGEKFLIVLGDTDFVAAVQCADRLRKVVEKVGRQLSSRLSGIKMTVSIGATSYQGGDETYDDLLIQADRALQMAKDGGCNTVVGHAPRYLGQKEVEKGAVLRRSQAECRKKTAKGAGGVGNEMAWEAGQGL
ncbi:MAG: diguanylate cyclase [Magnetococcales bacterium]|nr:diguanylate cyclase [Magnetococcales bacterium]